MSNLTSAAYAAARIPDGRVVTVSSSSALDCPDLVLAAIGARFDAEGQPRDRTTIHSIAAGDMYGVKGSITLQRTGFLRESWGVLSFWTVQHADAGNMEDGRQKAGCGL